ncbi:hypothetical protein GE061_012249 [Apolygus lucorum]|uniref:Peptidase S1 domain-containing protein n=1 Tax=Apolygus lucorum TaxID=248454 RepID=A0A8S9XSZ2_APOLU|nr:hypothetical protein GE061_012249 [Apolygus lucorum]
MLSINESMGNITTAILPEKVPWLVKILSNSGSHIFSGTLITWEKVLTTCTAVKSSQSKYVEAGFRGTNFQKRNILNKTADERCSLNKNPDTIERYNIGIIIVDKPFTANITPNVVQFPTLNKRKYLGLTNQLMAKKLTCYFPRWTHNGTLESVKITAIDTYRMQECRKYQGVHEFVCSIILCDYFVIHETMNGAPVICGEEIYGIMTVALKSSILLVKDVCVYIWLRLDEFVHLITEDDPELEDYVIHNEY